MADFFNENRKPASEPAGDRSESAQVSRELRQIAGQLTRSIQQLAAQLDHVLGLAAKVESLQAGLDWSRALATDETPHAPKAAPSRGPVGRVEPVLPIPRMARADEAVAPPSSEHVQGVAREVVRQIVADVATSAEEAQLRRVADRLERASEVVRADELASNQVIEDIALRLRELGDVAPLSSERGHGTVREAARENAAAASSGELRRSYRVGELPDDVVSDLRDAKMDDRHAHLDSLMQD
jgi:hypothetical protein